MNKRLSHPSRRWYHAGRTRNTALSPGIADGPPVPVAVLDAAQSASSRADRAAAAIQYSAHLEAPPPAFPASSEGPDRAAGPEPRAAPPDAAQRRKMDALDIGYEKGVYEIGHVHTRKLADAEDHALALVRLDGEDGGR